MSKTILMVDDSISLRLVVRMTLEGEGYHVIDAEDGLKARECLDGRQVDLVLSDLNMPGMDGLSLLKHIRQLPTYQHTPVIMLTSESATYLRQEGQHLGLNGWIVKPFEPPQLLAAIARLVQI